MIEREKLKLAPLQGSEKQIAWAEKIRDNTIEMMDRAGATLDAIQDYADIDSAKWLIDHREMSINNNRESMARVLYDRKTAVTEEIVLGDFYMVAPAKLHSEICPLVEERGNTVTLKSPYDKELIELCKDYGLRWDENMWSARYSGERMAENKAAELAHKLLLEGYQVRLVDEHIYEMAITASYDIEAPGWVDWEDKDHVRICWSGDAGRLRNDAREISGAKFSGNGVKVPASSYREIEDFAEMNDCEITDRAREVMEAWRAKTITIDVPPAPERKQTAKLKKVMMTETEIIEDLLED